MSANNFWASISSDFLVLHSTHYITVADTRWFDHSQVRPWTYRPVVPLQT